MIPLSIDPATGEIISGPDGLPAAFASLVDYDVLLVQAAASRRGNVTTKNYQAYLPVNLGPIPVAIKRGYVAADLIDPRPGLPGGEHAPGAAHSGEGDPGGPGGGAAAGSRVHDPAGRRRRGLQLRAQRPGKLALGPDDPGGIHRPVDGAPGPAAGGCHLLPLTRPAQCHLDARPPARLCLGPVRTRIVGWGRWS